MRKIYALLVIALLSISFRTFDGSYFALTVPFTQDWTTTTQITANDVWTGVLSIQGFRGDGLTGATGTDPRTILVADDPGVLDVNANQSNPTSFVTGGVTEFDGIANPAIALTGSGTATAPYIKIYLNTTGVSDIRVQYNVRDIEASADNAVQQVALQYRVGSTGAFTNIPAGYIADATTVTTATQVTPIDVTLPAACDNQPQVELRIMTTNAAGNDEWVGIDDIVITPNTVGGGGNTVSLTGGGNIPEAGPAGSFTLTFSAPTAAPTTVDYSLTPGTATITTDYSITLNNGATPTPLTTTTGTITVPGSTTSVTLTVTPSNDVATETNETVDLTISNPSGGYTVSGGNAVATIVDDDVPPPPGGIDFTGVTYTQDFNTLATSGTSGTTPTGWLFSESATNANTLYTAGTGSGTAGDTYSFGTDPDRAFGGLRSGNLIPTIGARVDNNSGATISSLAIGYRGEQWRLGSIGRNDRLDFQYSLDATSLTTGTWTNVDGLDFIGPLSSGATGPKDGNDPANYIEYNFTINGLSIPAGATFYIRWLDVESAGSDDGLAIDNFSMSLGCTPPTNQPTVLNFTPALTSISGSFTPAAAGTVAADAYLVIISASPALTEQPLSGTTYAIDDVIGNGEVVSISSSTSFTATGLDPATTYYFFVYSNSLPTNCYTINAPLTDNIATSSPPACTPPTNPATGLNATSITGTSMDLNYTRGNGDNILIVARTGSSVNSNPINGVSYPAGSQIGTGNFVIYNGSASTFPYTGLTQNTTYYFALYEYSVATPCYNTSALTGNFTTTCVTPVNPTGFGPTAQNGAVFLSWTNPTVSCFDEVLVIASNAPITGAGNTFIGAGNPAYAGPDQVVFRGIGTNVTVTGLTNGTNYYFKIFTRNSGSYSSGVQVNAVPFDPSTGFMYLYGNLHSHSSYSDGNQDNTTKTPADDYAFARDANCMDFLGISEHNHSLAGLLIGDYKLGYAQAEAINGVPGPGGRSLIALWGMEWGTIGTGGHVLVYGFGDQLIGWEAGNYDIYCNVGDYTSLLTLVNNQPNAFASLAHPDNGHFENLRNVPYSAAKDEALVGTAIESGPAFSHSTTYNDFPSSLGYMSYYRALLAKGYRIGAFMDQDNHNMTFGTANSNRLVVLTPAKTRAELVNAIRNMRFYASEDCNVQIDYKVNSGVVGSSVVNGGKPSISVSVVDGDGENLASVELWGGQVGGASPGSPIKTYPAPPANSFTFNSGDVANTQPDNTTYYYYLVLTQDDGNKMVTSPIWFSRSDILLPVTLINFNAAYSTVSKSTSLTWTTAQEFNSKEFVAERSNDGGRSWIKLGTVAAAGTTTSFTHYEFSDLDPRIGTNLYRLKQVDIDGHFSYSQIVSVVIRDKSMFFTVKPNPAVSGVANVFASSTTTTKATIQLLDINGKMIRQGQYIVGSTTPAKVNLAGVNQGVYFLRIDYDAKTTVEKILVR